MIIMTQIYIHVSHMGTSVAPLTISLPSLVLFVRPLAPGDIDHTHSKLHFCSGHY